MYFSHVDFQNVVDAYLLVKTRDIKVSNEDLRELAFSSKDLMAIVNAKKPGEEIVIADTSNNKVPVLYK